MQNVKPYRYTIGRNEEDLKQCLDHLKDQGFRIRYDNIKNRHNARKRIRWDRECHVIINKIPSGKYRAYLHIDILVSDISRIHRVLRDPDETERWGEKTFGDL